MHAFPYLHHRHFGPSVLHHPIRYCLAISLLMDCGILDRAPDTSINLCLRTTMWKLHVFLLALLLVCSETVMHLVASSLDVEPYASLVQSWFYPY